MVVNREQTTSLVTLSSSDVKIDMNHYHHHFERMIQQLEKSHKAIEDMAPSSEPSHWTGINTIADTIIVTSTLFAGFVSSALISDTVFQPNVRFYSWIVVMLFILALYVALVAPVYSLFIKNVEGSITKTNIEVVFVSVALSIAAFAQIGAFGFMLIYVFCMQNSRQHCDGESLVIPKIVPHSLTTVPACLARKY